MERQRLEGGRERNRDILQLQWLWVTSSSRQQASVHTLAVSGALQSIFNGENQYKLSIPVHVSTFALPLLVCV